MTSHFERVSGIRSSFVEAANQMVARLEQMDDATATMNPPTGWNAAQIVFHTAVTNEFLAGAVGGTIAEMSVPKPGDFAERLATLQLPERVQTFPMLEPPVDASKAGAAARMRASVETFLGALSSAGEDRCGTTCIKMPFGLCSIYEVGEFAAAHIHRHVGQIDRTLAS